MTLSKTILIIISILFVSFFLWSNQPSPQQLRGKEEALDEIRIKHWFIGFSLFSSHPKLDLKSVQQ